MLPELVIPCYPFGMTFGFTVGSRKEAGREDWKRYYDGSIVVPGKETEALGKAAKKAKAYVSIGVSERDAVSGTLYNSNKLIEEKLDYVGEMIKSFCLQGLDRTMNQYNKK